MRLLVTAVLLSVCLSAQAVAHAHTLTMNYSLGQTTTGTAAVAGVVSNGSFRGVASALGVDFTVPSTAPDIYDPFSTLVWYSHVETIGDIRVRIVLAHETLTNSWTSWLTVQDNRNPSDAGNGSSVARSN